jgi:hypothetical protein
VLSPIGFLHDEQGFQVTVCVSTSSLASLRWGEVSIKKMGPNLRGVRFGPEKHAFVRGLGGSARLHKSIVQCVCHGE